MRGFDFNGAGEQANCFACVWDLKAGSMSDEAKARLTAEAGSRKIESNLSVTKSHLRHRLNNAKIGLGMAQVEE
jgi:hypothetical protein